MNHRPAPFRRYRAHLLSLEPRMMFDAAAAVMVHEAIADAHDAAHADTRAMDARPVDLRLSDERVLAVDAERAVPLPAATGNAVPAPREIIFIDTSVADYRQLAAEWAGRGQVVLIDGTRDGIDQMRGALAGQSDIAAIHLVSHGAAGTFWLGTTRVDAAAIGGDLAGSLAAIGRSLDTGGDILIYGCDFAEGVDGARALAAFAQATGADVAASTDTTGFAPRGGDWLLEAHRGSIEARALDGGDWVHALRANDPVPIAVRPDGLIVTNGAGAVIVTGATGYGTDASSPDVGVGAVAVWTNAATFQGQSVDLRATVVSLTAGDAVRFNRPTATGENADDPTFLLRDLTTGATPATVQLRWDLVNHATGQPLAADVRFTISDIDGIGGNPNSRETVTAATTGLAYFTREAVSDINFTSSLDAIAASGTQNENTVAGQAITSKSAATFDWSAVSTWTLTYTLTNNAVTTQAQFYQDGDADFLYTNPVYVSIPRLDLDGDNSTAAGNDARFTFAENGPAVSVVDRDIGVSNPMPDQSINSGTVVLTNYQAGDMLLIGAGVPANITASVGAVTNGTVTVTLSGIGTEADYAAAFKAISFANTSDTPDPTQRVVQVSFSNGNLTSAVATSRIDVTAVNDAPVAVNDSATTAEDTPVTLTPLANDRDAEGDPLTLTAAAALHGNVVRNADGTLLYTPDADFYGTDTASYTISDGNGGTASATIAVTVTPVNDAPRAAPIIGPYRAVDGATVRISVVNEFGDVDGDALTYTATGLPAGISLDPATGLITGTVDRSASQINGGSYSVTLTATDPSGASATAPVTVLVTNPAPTAANDSATTSEDTPISIAVLANDRDPDGDPLAVIAASALHGTVVRNADGTLTYTPEANYTGADTISYTIDDGQGGTASATVAVTITPVNDAPGTVGTLPARAGQDAQAVSFATAGSFADVDGDRLSYSATGLPAGLSIDAATGVIAGTIDRSASQTAGGGYAVTVTARDPSNTAATQAFTYTVTNPAPVAVDDTATTAEDTSVVIAVLNNDRDADGDPLSVTAASASHGTVVRNADGTLTYTPDANFSGSDTLTYTIADGEGGTASARVAITVTPVNDAPLASGALADLTAIDGDIVSYATAGGFADVDGDALTYSAAGLPTGLAIDAATGTIMGTLDRSASQTGGGRYTVTVTAHDGGTSATQQFAITVTNPAPVATADATTTHADTAVIVAVLGNDRDPDGDPLRVTGATAGLGSVAVLADGTLRYKPPAGFVGRDTISYAIDDGQGGTSSAVATVVVTNAAPSAVPLAPVAATDRQAVSLDLRARFGDADGDPLSFAAFGLPAGLSIDARTGIITGTIDRSASQVNSGSYAATITATDPYGASAAATLNWTVTDPAPVALDDSATMPEDTPVTLMPLANDTDPDGDPLSITAASALHGSVAINADGTLTYTPDADFNGTDSVGYTISDGQGGTASATIAVTVTPVNDAPLTQPGTDTYDVLDGAPVSIAVAAAFADSDGDTLVYAATGLPTGLSVDPATGVITGSVDRSASQNNGGSYRIMLTATDPSGAVATRVVTMLVTNPAPVAGDDSIITAEDTSVVITVLANDTDPDGDPLSVTMASALHGSVVRNADGTLSYTPDGDYNGIDTISYTIEDGQGGSADATIEVTVTPVNDAPVARGVLPDRMTEDGAAVSYAVADAFGDIDGDTLAYRAAGLPAACRSTPSPD